MRENALSLICYGKIPRLVHVVMIDDRSARVNPGIIILKDHEAPLSIKRYNYIAILDRSDQRGFN